MANDKVVNIYVEEGILLRIVRNKKKADLVIESCEKTVVNCSNNEELIKKYLVDNGISTKAGGFKYLIMAINIVGEKLDNNKRYSLSKYVYPLIAEKYSVTPSSVDRAICNVIERSFVKGIGPKRFIEKYKLGV